jgi:hypothetical protein
MTKAVNMPSHSYARPTQIWLDNEVTPALATGSYGHRTRLVTVGAVYASWTAVQATSRPNCGTGKGSVQHPCLVSKHLRSR